MENINDDNNPQGDPTPESDGEEHDSDSIADQTLDLGVPDEIPEFADDMDANNADESPQDAPFVDQTAGTNTQGDTFAAAPGFDEPTQTIPPPPQVAAASRLTRDPYATLGGVLSGIAHNYGWDVALTRLAFIVILFLTGGTALIAYLLAWVLIPRASHWPPATTHRRGLSSFSPRDIGVGLVALGALVVLGVSSGEAAAVLVPLALVGGGVWLLVQNPRTEPTPQMAAPQMGAPVNAAYAGSMPMTSGATPPPMQPVPPANYYAQQPVAPQPAPKRSRLRRVAIVGGIGFLGLMLLAVVAVPLIVVGAIASGEADFEFSGEAITYSPATVEAIPALIDEDGGEIFIDLTNVDFSEITDDADPVSLEVNLDAGEIRVLVPNDVRVTVDAETDFVGELDIFDSQTDGISPEVSIDSDDPQLILDLEVNAGRIEVTRVG